MLDRAKETYILDVDRDPISGRKVLNQYEIIGELGRGGQGKVKLGRDLHTGQVVAIKIVDRYQKRKRLGRQGTREEKAKREVAILKKARHPNVVSLLEVIDDPAKMKVYMVLELVQLGEIRWQRESNEDIEHKRLEAESRADSSMQQRARDFSTVSTSLSPITPATPECWSLDHGAGSEEETESAAGYASLDDAPPSLETSTISSPESHRSPYQAPLQSATTSLAQLSELSLGAKSQLGDFDDPPAHTLSLPRTAHESLSYEYDLNELLRSVALGKAKSTVPKLDPYQEGSSSIVPCFTIPQARQTFRDTVLGLEYLHYHGIIHRDIKPANLLWTTQHRVKISDFGVSYLGRPMRDDYNDDMSESDAKMLDEAVELAKTVGTPAFYAPELCDTDFSKPRPSISGQIDVWSLGVTLYCLLFAKLPFTAKDDFALYKAIATKEVDIPSRRLRVEELNSPSRSSPRRDKRAEDDLMYEEIDDTLRDLLRRLLKKDPRERITIREVKRHPWVVEDIPDPAAWAEETDPARQNQGKKIEISPEDVEKAVVPVNLLDRVKSGVRKGLKGLNAFLGKKDGRKRARSTATTAEGTLSSVPTTPSNSSRRPSMRGDDTFFPDLEGKLSDAGRPYTRSLTSSPANNTKEDPFFVDLHPLKSMSAEGTPRRRLSSIRQPGALAYTRHPTLERTVSTSGESTRTLRPSRSYESQFATVSPVTSPGLDLALPDIPDLPVSTHIGVLFSGPSARLGESIETLDRVQQRDS
ncbi:MAG: hypothetical protein M1829_002900 [Trizodia sp. TS-e1964]|nr:MAG: hypothetical protein M1829_002900 [Trizodia sp. TS-e1964]